MFITRSIISAWNHGVEFFNLSPEKQRTVKILSTIVAVVAMYTFPWIAARAIIGLGALFIAESLGRVTVYCWNHLPESERLLVILNILFRERPQSQTIVVVPSRSHSPLFQQRPGVVRPAYHDSPPAYDQSFRPPMSGRRAGDSQGGFGEAVRGPLTTENEELRQRAGDSASGFGENPKC